MKEVQMADSVATVKYYCLTFLIAAVVTTLLDVAWINLFVLPQYQPMVHAVQGASMGVRPLPGLLAYLFITLGVTVVTPKDQLRPFRETLFAALFGLVVYGVYAWTVCALLAKWSIWVAVGDTLWGPVLYGVSAFVTSFISYRCGVRPPTPLLACDASDRGRYSNMDDR